MGKRTIRNHLLMSAATIVVGLTGYGRGAHAQVVCLADPAPPDFTCNGPSADQQTIVSDDATVSTVAGFSVNTPDPIAITITGDGALSYRDINASPLSGAEIALDIRSTGDITGGNPGSIAVGTGGSLTGEDFGIRAHNYGSGSIAIVTSGDVTSTRPGVNDPLAEVEPYSGIFAKNYSGEGSIFISADTVTGAGGANGINARNGSAQAYAGKDIVIHTTGAVEGGRMGIFAQNYGTGETRVHSEGPVIVTGGDIGNQWAGIFARNGFLKKDGGSKPANTLYEAGTNVIVTGEAEIVGFFNGIVAYNYGSGYTKVHTSGEVIGKTQAGIFARNGSPETDITYAANTGTYIEVVAEADVTGGVQGIRVGNSGTGHLKLTSRGTALGRAEHGILANNFENGTYLHIEAVNAYGRGLGDITENAGIGIGAFNEGSGDLKITATGNVVGEVNEGIIARNYGTDLSIQANNVSGNTTGIDARNYGSGPLSIAVAGNVVGKSGHGIDARHSNGGPIEIAVTESASVTAETNGFAIDSYGGPTSLTVAGTLNGGAGGAVQFDDNAVFNDRLALSTTAKINGDVFAGPGSDTLAFVGEGEGEFDLSDINTGGPTRQYQGFENFQVESGIWSFSGATSAAFEVQGGTLGGTGTFGGLTVNDGGTLASGNSIGTITVNGAFALNAGAIFEAEVNAAGESDKVIVNGTVNLTGATLKVLAAGGDYAPETDYTIIENDGNDAVTGTFGTVTSNLVFLDPSVAYDAGDGNDVVLTLTRNATLFQDVAQTKNEKSVAGALDKFPTDNGLYLAVANQTVSGARQAFNALSGEIHGTVAGTLADDSRYTREAVLGRLMQATHGNNDPLGANGPQVASLYDGKSLTAIEPARAPLAFWTQGFGAWGDYDSDGNAASASRDLGGFISGLDADIGGSWRAGFATGASFSSVDVNARNSAADVETYHLGGYVGGMVGGFALRGGGLYAWNSIDTSRAVIFPGFFERQNASYDADTGQLFGEIAYPTKMDGIALEPFGGLAFVSVDTDSFRERGGALASLRGKADQDVGYTTLGLRAATTMQWGNTQVTPHISAAWQHAFDDVTPGASLAFASNGIGFGIDGVPLAQNAALLDAGLDFALGENGTAGVSYSGQYGDGVTDNAVKGRITWLF